LLGQGHKQMCKTVACAPLMVVAKKKLRPTMLVALIIITTDWDRSILRFFQTQGVFEPSLTKFTTLYSYLKSTGTTGTRFQFFY
jgi:hypothetical protein